MERILAQAGYGNVVSTTDPPQAWPATTPFDRAEVLLRIKNLLEPASYTCTCLPDPSRS